MNRKEIFKMIEEMLRTKVKGQIQIDFSGDGEGARLRFTNISMEDLKKLKIKNQE